MKAPWLVPPTASSGTPASSRAVKTPRCARPREPPPDSTSPTARPAIQRDSLVSDAKVGKEGQGVSEGASVGAVRRKQG
jgi:hypothetical protein